MKKRVVAIFTGNRAEYGLQLPVLEAIKNHPQLEYRLIVSGAHLDPNFGKTISEIKNDGFTIHDEVQIKMEDGKSTSTALAIASGIASVTEVLNKMKPDVFIVYADRFEGFAAVIASTQMNIPTGHIEGGDITEGGALDDSVRHAMSKLAHFHFTTNDQASNRVMGMGEESWRVKTVGFPAIDLIVKGNYATPQELTNLYRIDLQKPIVLFTQHSVTTEFDLASDQVVPSIEAIRRLAAEGVQVILTYPNNDSGGKKIIEKLESLKDEELPNIQVHKSLGRYNYHGILALAKDPNIKVVCMGNSSSGIKETPAFHCPTVNIGSRQEGRLRAENVVDSEYNAKEIYEKIILCLGDEFRENCKKLINPYGIGDAGIKIADFLANVDLSPRKVLRKKMTLKGQKNENGWFC